MRLRLEEQEQISIQRRISQEWYRDPYILIPCFAGAALGFWAGGKWPSVMTRIYGLGLGAGVALFTARLVREWR